jgi:glycosyltransferase involved in cell wall biosynthesis
MIDRVLTGLASRGHTVSAVYGGPVTKHSYEVINAGGTYSQYLTAPIICMTRFRTADVLIDVENGIPYFSPIWRRRSSICLVHHVHTDQWHGRFPGSIASLFQAIESRLMPAIYRRRIFLAVSNSTADALCAIGVPREHIRIVESGVDVPSGPLVAKSIDPLFISLNRLVPHKRTDLLLDAWELASAHVPGRLLIVGDGPELSNIRRKAAGISRVDVMGRVSQEMKARLLAESWAVLSTAHHEGWGMSIMEAAAAGTPALAVDAPGIRDAVIDGVTGILVSAPEDELPSALAREWVALTADQPRREALGLAARERAKTFSWDRTIDRWVLVLEEVTNPQNGRALHPTTESVVPSPLRAGLRDRSTA